MDPWGATNIGINSEQKLGGAENLFQDSFLDECANQFERLPDSEEYLKILEDKLRKLDKKKALKSCEETKQDILGNLLRSESKQIVGILNSVDLELDREVNTNLVFRQLIPKQPLTVGETVRLVESDQLDKTYSEGLGATNQMSD